nr:GTPase [Campylobacter jejuni]
MIISAKFITSLVKFDENLSSNFSEVAFLGRSNVGKSSLINSLCKQKNLAKSSATPGLNLIVGFFGMNTNNLFFKDSPYGTLYIFSLICCILIVGFIFYHSKKTKEFDLDEGKKAKKQTK